jgi:hypothetical protein
MGERCVVAKGEHGDGLEWVIWVRRDEPSTGNLLTMLRVKDAGGRILHAAGTSGPALAGDHLLEVSTGGSEEGPRALVARVHPTGRRCELKTRDGNTVDVPLYDCPDVPEVRFGCLLLDRDLQLESAVAYGAEGDELARFDLRLQQGRWEIRRGPALPAPGTADSSRNGQRGPGNR